jgi:hypothetical protein
MCSKLSFVRFIWNFHRDCEAQEHVTSYNYPDKVTFEPRDVTFSELLSESLCVQEYPHPEDPEKEFKCPFKGLFQHTQIARKLHDGSIYVSMRPTARNSRELNAELAFLKLEGFGNHNHYPFLFQGLHTDDAHQPTLELAASALANWQAKKSAAENMF